MVSAKKLIKMARKWQKLAAASRKRISFPRTNYSSNEVCGSNSRMADKGHFFVYSSDQKQFMIPLAYLKTEIFHLFKMAEEEFGVPRDGPITLPCDSILMEYALSIIKRHAAKELENLLLAPTSCQCSTTMLSWHQEQMHQPICSF